MRPREDQSQAERMQNVSDKRTRCQTHLVASSTPTASTTPRRLGRSLAREGRLELDVKVVVATRGTRFAILSLSLEALELLAQRLLLALSLLKLGDLNLLAELLEVSLTTGIFRLLDA